MFNSRTPDGGPTPATGAKHVPFSLFGGDVTVTGDVSASVDLHIDGKVTGDVACAALVQGTDSVIRGAVTARTARIAGTIEGSITADELVVERSARIIGDCTYGSLNVDPGATIDGRMTPKAAAAPVLTVVAGGE